MTAREHITSALAHLDAARSAPLLIGGRAAETVRSQLGLAETFSRHALERLDQGLVQVRPGIAISPATCERGCPRD